MLRKLFITTITLTVLLGLAFIPTLKAGEHPGDEHAGDEHGGKPVKKEHGGKPVTKEHAGDEAKTYTAAQIKKTMQTYIDTETSNNNGTFVMTDKDKNNQKLKLKFVKIHDPVRKIEGKGYFACTDFHVDGQDDKIYDLDFWLNSKDGKLVVTKAKVHKDPVQEQGKWVKKARYTFVNDKPVEIK